QDDIKPLLPVSSKKGSSGPPSPRGLVKAHPPQIGEPLPGPGTLVREDLDVPQRSLEAFVEDLHAANRFRRSERCQEPNMNVLAHPARPPLTARASSRPCTPTRSSIKPSPDQSKP